MCKLITVSPETFPKICKGYINYIALQEQEVTFTKGDTLSISEYTQDKEVFGDILHTTVKDIITSKESRGIIEGYALVFFTIKEEPTY